MAEGIFEANGESPVLRAASGSVHVAAKGLFGGGTIDLQQKIAGSFDALTDGTDPITITDTDGFALILGEGTVFKLVLSGATNPNIEWSVTGVTEVRQG